MRTIAISSFFAYSFALGLLLQVTGILSGARNIPRRESPRFHLIRTISFALIILGVFTMKDDQLDNLQPLRLIGGIAVVIGLGISIWAQRTLGRNWVGGIGLHRRHELITTGPYRYVRHPLYSGMLLSSIGLCLVSLNVFYGLGGVGFALAYCVRIPFEEDVLRRKFKEQYRKYEEATGSVIPRFRRGG